MPIQTIDFGTVNSATYNGSDVSSIILNGSEIWSSGPAPDAYLATDTGYTPGSHAPLYWDINSTWSPTAHVILPLVVHNGQLYIGYLIGDAAAGNNITEASSNITYHGRYMTVGNPLTSSSSFNISFNFKLNTWHAYSGYTTIITSNIAFNGSVITENVEFYFPDSTFGTFGTRNGGTRYITLNRGAGTIQVSPFSNGYTNMGHTINYSADTSHSSPVSSVYHYGMGTYGAGVVYGPYINLIAS